MGDRSMVRQTETQKPMHPRALSSTCGFSALPRYTSSTEAQCVAFQYAQTGQSSRQGFSFSTMLGAFPNLIKANLDRSLSHFHQMEEVYSVAFTQDSCVISVPFSNDNGTQSRRSQLAASQNEKLVSEKGVTRI